MSMGYNAMGTQSSNCGFMYNGNKSGIIDKVLAIVIPAAISAIVSFLVVRKLAKTAQVSESSHDTLEKVKGNFVAHHPDFVKPLPPANVGNCPADEPFDVVKQPYLLFNRLMHNGEITALVAPAGGGKTFLACEIAKPLKKVVYIALDDTGANQQKRFEQISSILCITSTDFENYLKELKGIALADCENRALWGMLFRDYRQFIDRKQKLAKELGASESPKLDRLLILEMILESKICEDADLIVLDSLNGLLDYEWQISRPYLNRITHACREMHKSMLILHHTNRKNEYKGNTAFIETMDLVLQLNPLGKSGVKPNRVSTLELTVEKSRYLQDCEGCTTDMRETGDHSVEFVVHESTAQGKELGKLPLKSAILHVLQMQNPISFEELANSLSCDQTSIKNALKQMEDKGCLRKADGKTWANIILSETAETV